MYKNFKITEEEKKQILESHRKHGYKSVIKEQESWDNDFAHRDTYDDGYNDEYMSDSREMNDNDMAIGVDGYGKIYDLQYDESSDEYTLYDSYGDRINFDFLTAEQLKQGHFHRKNIINIEDPKTGRIVKILGWREESKPERFNFNM
jgi:hypothetical protein